MLGSDLGESAPSFGDLVASVWTWGDNGRKQGSCKAKPVLHFMVGVIAQGISQVTVLFYTFSCLPGRSFSTFLSPCNIIIDGLE